MQNTPLAPAHKRLLHVGEKSRMIDKKNRAPFNPDVTGIAEIAEQIIPEGNIVFRAVLLCDEYFLVLSVPAASPVLVGPVEAEGHINFRMGKKLVNWFFHQPLSGKPVVMETKTINSVLFRHFCLTPHDFRVKKIVISQ